MDKLSPETGAPLKTIEFDGEQLDVATDTGGIWFDRGELTPLRHRTDYALKDLENEAPISQSGPAQPATLLCPNDQSALVRRTMGLLDTLPIYECDKCGGMWIGHETLDHLARQQQLDDPNFVPPDLTPEAKEALAEFTSDHEQFMQHAAAATRFWRNADNHIRSAFHIKPQYPQQ